MWVNLKLNRTSQSPAPLNSPSRLWERGGYEGEEKGTGAVLLGLGVPMSSRASEQKGAGEAHFFSSPPWSTLTKQLNL